MSAGDLGRIDGSSLLIVRGASTTEELATLGLPFAEIFARSDEVVLVNDGRGREVKGRAISGEIRFVDADSRLASLARVIERIADEYVKTHQNHAHLSHAIIGKFLIYTHVERDSTLPVSVLDLIRLGEIAAVERAAEHFIDSRFESMFVRSDIPMSSEDNGSPPNAEAIATPDADLGVDRVGQDDARDIG